MVVADFSNTDSILIYTKEPLYQYNKGQHLNVIGLDSEYFYSAKFVTDESITYVTNIEDIKNGFRVEIPDEILSENGHYKDYWIMVYLNFTDDTNTITTIKVVNILVKFISETERIENGIDYSNGNLTIDSLNNVTITDDENGNVIISEG